MELIARINKVVEKKGYSLLVIRDFPHKDDHFLKSVVGKRGNKYVCWTYNDNDNALYEGYYTDSFESAYQKMIERTM